MDTPTRAVIRSAIDCLVVGAIFLGGPGIAHADGVETYCFGKTFGHVASALPGVVDVGAVRNGSCDGVTLRVADESTWRSVQQRLGRAEPCTVFGDGQAYVTKRQHDAIVAATRRDIEDAGRVGALKRPPLPLSAHVERSQLAGLHVAGVISSLEQALRERLASRSDHMNPDLVASIVAKVLQRGIDARCVVAADGQSWFGLSTPHYDRVVQQLRADAFPRPLRRDGESTATHRLRGGPETTARSPALSTPTESPPAGTVPVTPIVAVLLGLLLVAGVVVYRRRRQHPMVEESRDVPVQPPPDPHADISVLASGLPTQLIGVVIDGRYTIEAALGGGGMSQVFVARHVHTGQEVAIKLLRRENGAGSDLEDRFRREAQMLARLEHPNIVRLQDFGVLSDGTQYLVMERLRGADLRSVLEDAGGTLSANEAVQIISAVLQALHAAHQHGIVHRDLKPENIMLCDSGGQRVIKLIDFGIASQAEQSRLTRTGIVVGTPAYLSPEQARGESVGVASDLYSAALILYELLSGALPFSGDTALALAIARVTGPARPPQLPSDTDVSQAMIDVIMAALSMDPWNRPATAQLMEQQLRTALLVPRS